MENENKMALKTVLIFFVVFSIANIGTSSGTHGIEFNATKSIKGYNIFGVLIWSHALQVTWFSNIFSGYIVNHYAVQSAAGHNGLNVKEQSLTLLYEDLYDYVHYQAYAKFGTIFITSATSYLQIKAYVDGSYWTWSNL